MIDATTRPPAVAGLFYPGEASSLLDMVDDLLESSPDFTLQPKAMICPHAGYIYSGSTAAMAYSSLPVFADKIKKVIILGPAHTMYLRGIACHSADYFATPLGSIPLDSTLRETILKLPFVQNVPEAHASEHCLEVQLPFCQRVLKEFTLLPLIVGDTTKENVMQLLNLVWGGPETLIIISSDLSHYLSYFDAQERDKQTCFYIDNLEEDGIEHDSACGYFPLRGFLAFARHRGMLSNRLALCNSGDTAGDKSRVVGYTSYHFYEPLQVGQYCGDELLELADNTIESHAVEGRSFKYNPRQYSDVMNLRIPTFITLTKDDQLRGCMGSLKAKGSLAENVIENAYRAAFLDPRFPPIDRGEVIDLTISISLLSPMKPLSFDSFEHFLEQLIPGQDGLLLQYLHYRATFLPSVWQTLPNKSDFIHHLLLKMGLTKNFWSSQMQAWTYQTEYIQAKKSITPP